MPEIVPYNPLWPIEYAAIAVRLRQALGGLALCIDHIGSTSVPGLPAKDIIDIQVTVAALEKEVVERISGMGFVYAESIDRDHLPPGFTDDEGEWRKLFFNAPIDQRHTHIHVRVQGRANQRYPLLFRDYLRAHPASAAAYAELKQRLAHALADPTDYPDVKDPAVDLIYLAAEDWAATVRWMPDAGDS